MPTKHSFPPEVLGRMKSRWESGDRAEDIAEDLKVHPNTIRYQAKQRGWERGSKEGEYIEKVSQAQKQVVISDKVERSIQETEKFMQDAERIRALVLNFQGRMVKNRDPVTNELILDKKEGDLIFQYLKCCKISMESLVMGYMGKRKALGMDEVIKDDINILPWED